MQKQNAKNLSKMLMIINNKIEIKALKIRHGTRIQLKMKNNIE